MRLNTNRIEELDCMKETNEFAVVDVAFPGFRAWFSHFYEENPDFEPLNREGIHPCLDYLDTVDDGVVSLLLGIYLAQTEVPTSAGPQANGALH
jgi:hypothetical protein